MFKEDEEEEERNRRKIIIRCHHMVLCYVTKIFNISSFVTFVQERGKTKKSDFLCIEIARE